MDVFRSAAGNGLASLGKGRKGSLAAVLRTKKLLRSRHTAWLGSRRAGCVGSAPRARHRQDAAETKMLKGAPRAIHHPWGGGGGTGAHPTPPAGAGGGG